MTEDKYSECYDVIGIGAGVAGLTFALSLSNYNKELSQKIDGKWLVKTPPMSLLLLEAKNRPLGRVKSSQIYFNNGHKNNPYMEEGAAWFHGEDNPFFAAIEKKLGNQGENYFSPNEIPLYAIINGKKIRKKYILKELDRFERAIIEASGGQDISVKDALTIMGEEKIKTFPHAEILLQAFVADSEAGVSIEEASVADLREQYFGFDQDRLVLGGMENLLTKFFEPDRLPIQLNSKVSKIDFTNPEIVKITYTKADEYGGFYEQDVFAKQVFLTVPIAQMKKSELEIIGLDETSQRLFGNIIDAANPALLDKVILAFDQPISKYLNFENTKHKASVNDQILFSDDGKTPHFFIIGPNNPYTISVFVGGTQAWEIEGENIGREAKTAGIAYAFGVLRSAFGESNLIELRKYFNPKETIVTNWGHEVGCSYTNVKPNYYDVLKNEIAVLANGRLMIGGEGFGSEYRTQITGAYNSGLAAFKKTVEMTQVKNKSFTQVEDLLPVVLGGGSKGV